MGRRCVSAHYSYIHHNNYQIPSSGELYRGLDPPRMLKTEYDDDDDHDDDDDYDDDDDDDDDDDKNIFRPFSHSSMTMIKNTMAMV